MPQNTVHNGRFCGEGVVKSFFFITPFSKMSYKGYEAACIKKIEIQHTVFWDQKKFVQFDSINIRWGQDYQKRAAH